MLGNKKKYDLIFSIGESCSCSQTLRRNNLQIFSYPFDWLGGSDFMGRVDILTSSFDNFINLEDFEYLEKTDPETEPKLTDSYYNKRNGIRFRHDFPLNIPIEKSYTDVKAKYDRRINRLFEQIEKSERILIVYIEIPSCQNKLQDNNILIEGYKKLSEKFSDKQIDLLFLTNCEEKKLNDICSEKISNDITKQILNYKSLRKNKKPRAINKKILRKIFRRYKLKLTIKQKLLNIIRAKILKPGEDIGR